MKKPEWMLDNEWLPELPVNFYNRLHVRDQIVRTQIKAICNHFPKQPDDNLFLEEKLYVLIGHLLEQEKDHRCRLEQLPGLKTSTREEINRRLLLAVDYIYTHFDRQLTLEELGRVAALSRFHFLRLFKGLFGRTPHQFITQVRLEKAALLLRYTRLTTEEIAAAVGLQYGASFSRLFHRRMGMYPSRYRQETG